MKNKRSSEEGSIEVEHSRAKCKSATETAAPRNAFFVVERKRFVKNVKEQPQKLHIARGYHRRFQSPNVQQVESLSEQWREMTSLFRNTEILSKS